MGDVDYYLARYPEPDFCFSPDADFPLICGEKGILHGEYVLDAPIVGGRIAGLEGGTVVNAIPGTAEALVRADAATLPAAKGVSVGPAGEGLARLVATGKGGHASMPEGTLNAIGLLARYLLAEGLCDGRERAFLELLRTLTEDAYGRAAGIASTDDKFGALTCVAGVVALREGRLTQTIDVRYPTSTTGEEVAAGLATLGQAAGCSFEVRSDNRPFYIPPDSPEIQALLTSYEEYTGRPGTAFVIGGGTYARHFVHACAFGPHDPADADPEWVGIEHGPDEGISEEALRRALKIYITSIAKLMEL